MSPPRRPISTPIQQSNHSNKIAKYLQVALKQISGMLSTPWHIITTDTRLCKDNCKDIDNYEITY